MPAMIQRMIRSAAAVSRESGPADEVMPAS
jgi:hypothetical protein